MKPRIYMIPIVGGPGSGKTTFMEHKLVPVFFRKNGYLTLFMEEPVAILERQGITPFNCGGLDEYQDYFLRTQFEQEKEFLKKAQTLTRERKKSVIIFADRALLTSGAYLGDETNFDRLEQLIKYTLHMTINEVLNRYVGVLHLTSLAVDRPELYLKIKSGNKTRSEDIPEACMRDKRSREVWSIHSNWREVSNVYDRVNISEHEKLKRICGEILSMVS